jgi:predicted Zn-dependent protease
MNTRIELLKRYLQEEPGDSFLQYALALEFIALNQHEKAYEQLTNLLFNNPEYLPAYYMAGKSAEALNKIDEAKKWFMLGIDSARIKNDRHTLNELTSAMEELD